MPTSLVLASLFSRKGKLYQMRYGSDLTDELRFVFEKHPFIRDRSDNRLYTPADLKPDGRTTEDYAIVSRVFDSKTGELLIAATGITQYGTRSAGEFLTSAPLLAGLAANAPRNWPKKNLQVLLRTKIVEDTPGPPNIVRTYCW
jgi:hypothetical protein